jgi:hypothetical protein
MRGTGAPTSPFESGLFRNRGRNRGTQGEANEENMGFAPHGRCVSSFFGMSVFEKVMYE